MDEHEQEAQDEVKLPEERVEDLAPAEGDADDVTGGKFAGSWPKHVEIGNLKADS